MANGAEDDKHIFQAFLFSYSTFSNGSLETPARLFFLQSQKVNCIHTYFYGLVRQILGADEFAGTCPFSLWAGTHVRSRWDQGKLGSLWSCSLQKQTNDEPCFLTTCCPALMRILYHILLGHWHTTDVNIAIFRLFLGHPTNEWRSAT